MKRMCTYSPNCPNPAEGGTPRCAEHQAKYKRATDQGIKVRDSLRVSIYKTKMWIGTRRAVIRRDPFCKCDTSCCPLGCQRVSTVADHVIPLRVILERGGDPYDLDNLQGLAAPCHNRKTAQEVWH